MSSTNAPTAAAPTSSNGGPNQPLMVNRGNEIASNESLIAKASREADDMINRMLPAQRAALQRQHLADPANHRFIKDDKQPVLKKIFMQKILDKCKQEQGHAALATQNSATKKKARAPKPTTTQPLSPLAPQSNQQGQVTLAPAAPPPLLMRPSALQEQRARLPTEPEVAARLRLAGGISFVRDPHIKVCVTHHKQIQDLQRWGDTPYGGTFQPSVPSAPAVFKETITGETALLPQCRGCAIKNGAITEGKHAEGPIFHQVEVFDTCTCASDVLAGDCWFCELGRLEAMKQIAVNKCTVQQPIAHQAGRHTLMCGCGNHVQLPEAVRQCAGCGGIKTSPFKDFETNELIFESLSEQVEEVKDFVTEQPVQRGNRIPPCIPQEQSQREPSVPHGWGAESQIHPHAQAPALNDPDAGDSDQQLSWDNAEDIMRNIAKQARKRPAEQAFDDAAPERPPKRQQLKPQGRLLTTEPAEKQLRLFENGYYKALKKHGFKVWMGKRKSSLVTPFHRADMLLRDNADFRFEGNGWLIIQAMTDCGFEEPHVVALFDQVASTYDFPATGAQVLEVIDRTGWPRGPYYANDPTMWYSPANQLYTAGVQQQQSPLDPLFNADQITEFQELGFPVPEHPLPSGSVISGGYRAEALLRTYVVTNPAGLIKPTDLAQALKVCGMLDANADAWAWRAASEHTNQAIKVLDVWQMGYHLGYLRDADPGLSAPGPAILAGGGVNDQHLAGM